MLLLSLAGCLFLSDADQARFLDGDGDGHTDVALGGDDCDDADDAVTTGLLYADADGDGLGDPTVTGPGCEPGAGWVDNADDCDDTDPSLGLPIACHPDGDLDGWGADATVEACDFGADCLPEGGDCDDGDADAFPGASEFGSDDQDCDGVPGDSRFEGVGFVVTDFWDAAGMGYAAVALGDVGGERYEDLAVAVPGHGGGEVHVVPGVDRIGEVHDPQIHLVSTSLAVWTVDSTSALGGGLGAGDLNGDGDTDLVVSERLSDRAGALDVIYGPFPAGALTTDERLVRGGELGARMAVGDVTDDDARDIVALAPGEPALYVFDGPPDAARLAVDAFATVAFPRIEADDSFSLALGDFGGDGHDDFLVGAPGSDRGRTDAGAVWLCGGGAEGEAESADACVLYTGATAGDAFGAAVARGDFDGDGADDFAVGATGVDDGATASVGAVYVFVAAAGGLAGGLEARDASYTLLGEIGAGEAGGAAGAAVAAIDADGDGLDELAVGAPAWDDWYEGGGTGAVYVSFGPHAGSASLGDAGDRVVCLYTEGSGPPCLAGSFLAPGGDITGDGVPDLLAGVPGWRIGYEPQVFPGGIAVMSGGLLD